MLGTGITRWPSDLTKKTNDDLALAPDSFSAVASGVLDVKFVAAFTERVHVVFYLPFVVLFLLILSRNSYFDRWPWPFGLDFIFIVNFVIAFTCSWCIRRVAAKVKSEAIYNMKLAKNLSCANPELSQRISMAIEYTEGVQRGAYSNWLHNPSVIGTLVPTGSAGLIAIVRLLLGY
jgi:hypothetical protein